MTTDPSRTSAPGAWTDRRIRWQITWSSVRWRAGTSIATLVVAIAGIGVGTFGPIYLHGADQSVLQSTLRAAPAGNAGVTLLPAAGPDAPGRFGPATRGLPRSPGGTAWYGPPILTLDAPTSSNSVSRGSDDQAYGADLVSRTGVCRHLSFVSGGCPDATGTVTLSTRSAHELGLHQGEVITLHFARAKRPVRLTISGLYRAGNPAAPFWWGENFFGFGSSGSGSRPELDDFFASAPTLVAASPPGLVSRVEQVPLAFGALSVDDVPSFQHELSAFEKQSPSTYGLNANSQVGQLLSRAAGDQHTVATIVAVVIGELVLLSLMVLYFVASRVAETRESDVRVAELRGYSRGRTASVALVEPLALLVLSLPFGVVIAWLAARLVAPHVFAYEAAPDVTLAALGAALLTLSAGALATVLGTRHLLTRRRAAGSQRGRAIGTGPLAIAVDAVAVSVAVAATVEIGLGGVAAGNHTDPLAALAPGLLALGCGVLGARLLPLAARGAIPLTRFSRRVGTTVATRRLARRSELSRHVVVLSLAVGLAAFTVAGWSVAARNRLTQSQFEVGASRVLTVRTRTGVDFLSAVRRADPSGKSAMAVVVENAAQGDSLAVDASRLAAVASWPAGLSRQGAAAIGRALDPPEAPAIVVSGTRLRVAVDLERAISPAPQLQAVVFDDGYQSETTLNLGTLRAGAHTYQTSTAAGCPSSCRLVDLGVTWTPSNSSPGRSTAVPLEISSLSDRPPGGPWKVLAAGLGDPSRWRSDSGGVTIGRSPSGLTVQADVDADGAAAAFGPADVPGTLPAVVTGATTGGPPLAVGLDGSTITVKPVATVNALPGVGSGATMINLASAERVQTGPMIYTTLEVWLAAGAPPGMVHRLAQEGIFPVSQQSAIAREATLSQTGVSLAYALFLYAAVAALALAVGSTIVVVVAAARRRETELTSLLAVGIRRRSLHRSLLIEQGLVVGTGVVLGMAAGVGAAALALSSIPEFTSLGTGPPLDFQLPVGALGLTLLAIVAALAVTVGLAARLLVRHVSIETLGGGE